MARIGDPGGRTLERELGRRRPLREWALVAGSLGLAGCATPPAQGPSVVLVVVDTLRADHLTQYGYPRATSPALESLARESIRFERCIAPASWTTPSVASLFTGLLPARHRAESRGAALDRDALTLAEILRARGWTTLGVCHNHNLTRTTDFDQGFDEFLDFEGGSGEYPDVSEMRADALRLVGDSPRPLLLYLHPMNVHGPYRTPDEHRSDLLGAPPGMEFEYSGPLMDSIMKDGRLERRAEVTEPILRSHRDQYDTAIRCCTDQIGGILDDLRAAGLYDDSLVIVTADHGEELFDHEGFGHGYTLHDELLRVPLWIKLPGQRTARVVEQPVALIDLLPTILSVLGVPAPESVDGSSLAFLLDGEPEPGRHERLLISETRWPGRFVGSSVVAWPWKLIEVESSYDGRAGARLLFHLGDDPREREDRAQERPDVVRALAQFLEEHRRDPGAALRARDASDSMDRDLLRKLGYGD